MLVSVFEGTHREMHLLRLLLGEDIALPPVKPDPNEGVPLGFIDMMAAGAKAGKRIPRRVTEMTERMNWFSRRMTTATAKMATVGTDMGKAQKIETTYLTSHPPLILGQFLINNHVEPTVSAAEFPQNHSAEPLSPRAHSNQPSTKMETIGKAIRMTSCQWRSTHHHGISTGSSGGSSGCGSLVI